MWNEFVSLLSKSLINRQVSTIQYISQVWINVWSCYCNNEIPSSDRENLMKIKSHICRVATNRDLQVIPCSAYISRTEVPTELIRLSWYNYPILVPHPITSSLQTHSSHKRQQSLVGQQRFPSNDGNDL